MKPKIRVLSVIDSLASGGVQTFNLDIARLIDKSRFDFTVCALRTKQPAVADLYRENGVRLIELGLAKGNPLAVPLLMRIIKREGIQVVQTSLFASDTYGRFAALLSGVKGIVTHKVANDVFWKKRYQVSIDRLLTKKTDFVLANAEAVRDYYATVERVPAAKLRVIFTMPDYARFTAAPPLDLREELELPPDAMLIGTAGRLVAQKTIDTLLRAASGVFRKHDNAFLVIAGAGPLEAELRALADNLAISRRVFFLGARLDINSVMAALDVYANSSAYEGLPMTLLEAMSLAKPVVASAVDGNRELVTDGRTGLLFEPGSDAQLAACLDGLLSDVELRQRLGQAGRALVFEKYNITTVLDELQELYQELASPAVSSPAPPHAPVPLARR